MGETVFFSNSSLFFDVSHKMLIFLYQEHSYGEATSIWGPNQDNICNDGTNTNVDCNEEKYIFCSIKGKFTKK